MLRSGLVPGNRNNDNTCATLRRYTHLLYLNRSMQTEGIRAVLLKSFGFGQAGGEVLLVHPNYLLAALTPQQRAVYYARVQEREKRLHAVQGQVLAGQRPFVAVKSSPPYSAEHESAVYLNPDARARYDRAVGSWRFGAGTETETVEGREEEAGVEGSGEGGNARAMGSASEALACLVAPRPTRTSSSVL